MARDRLLLSLPLLLVACRDPDPPAPRLAPPIVEPAATATESARAIVARLAPRWHVTELPVLESRGEIPFGADHIVRFAQVIDGMPIDREEMRVFVRPTGELVMTSGTLRDARVHRDVARYAGTLATEAGAIARAVGSRTPTRARAYRAWHAEGDALVAAWVVEAYVGDEAWRSVIAAGDGRELAHVDLVENDTTSYRVFADGTDKPLDGPIADFSPHPTGVPDGSYPSYVTSTLHTITPTDPWLPAAATETNGNNADAYCDIESPDGLSAGDFRAPASPAGTFNYAYDLQLGPLANVTQQRAAIVSLFYIINYLHDFWYAAGFTEAAGNAQLVNYGRGGQDGDVILAEAQDGANDGSRNNANMATPADGMSPRMQVYLWSGKDDKHLDVLGPNAHTPASNTAVFGPANYDVTDVLRAGVDAMDPTTDGCTPYTNVLTSTIVLVDRGGCTYKTKVKNAQDAGARGVVIANNTTGVAPSLGDDSTITTPITIPAMSVTMEEGVALRAQLATGPLNVRLFRLKGTETEGSLDASVIAHELGHYVHHRLSNCNTRLCGAMSEGWGDFSSLLLAARDGDNLDGAFAMAQYVTQGISDDPAYFGIRRAPYSVDMTRNALSFRHISDGEPLPTTHPIDAGGRNFEVHNAGEIWAEMLWEGYVALQKARGGLTFEQARANMAKYVVAGLLMSPVDGTPTEVRDSILVATAAMSPADATTLAIAYARRGFGSCAVSPPRDSTDFTGVVESNAISGFADVADISLEQDPGACDDDGALDPGETGHVRVALANHGFADLSAIHATLSTSTAGLTIASPTVDIATLAPGASMMLSFDVSYDGPQAMMVAGAFDFALSATNGCGDVTRSIPVRLGVDDVPMAAQNDSFDAIESVWLTADSSAWQHQRESALDGFWHGNDLGYPSDVQLVSPPLSVGAGPSSMTFSHRYQFEFGDGMAYDGGVVEYTTDGGANWNDASMIATVPYTHLIDGSNAISGRMGFASTSVAYPAMETVAIDFGTNLANQTVQIRFRIATDPGVAAPGWDIDDVAFTGVVGAPFPAQVADPGVCGVGPGVDAGVDPTSDAGDTPPAQDAGCCSTSDLGSGETLLAIGVMAFIVRRRRIAAVRASWQGRAL